MSNVKGVFERKFLSPVEKGPQIGGFWSKRGEKLNFWFCDPQKAHPCAEPRLLTYFASKSVRGLGCRRFEDPLPQKRTNSRINNLMREIAHAQKLNPLSDLDEILQDGSYSRRNQVGKFWWRSLLRGLGVAGVKFWLFPLTLIVVLTTLSHYPASVWFFLFMQQDNAQWKVHATHGLTVTASCFNQWQRAFAVIPKNSKRFHGAGND